MNSYCQFNNSDLKYKLN